MTTPVCPRVFCIGRNYAEHAQEMGGSHPVEPVVFMKPSTSLLPEGQPLRMPVGLGSVHHEMELVVILGREGMDIPVTEALDYVTGATLGIDLTLRDLQSRLKQLGQPWELSKSFDGSAAIGSFRSPFPLSDIQNIDMHCKINGTLRQHGNTRDMLFPVAALVSYLSHHWKLLRGDLVYTGTPAGVGPLWPGDRIEIESPQIGRFGWDAI